MTDPASRIIWAYRNANDATWEVAELAAELFGSLSPGVTEEIAKACNKSVDTVGLWAKAFWMWELLGSVKELQALSLPFFYRLWDFREEAHDDLLHILYRALREGRDARWFGAILKETYGVEEDLPSVASRWLRRLDKEFINAPAWTDREPVREAAKKFAAVLREHAAKTEAH